VAGREGRLECSCRRRVHWWSFSCSVRALQLIRMMRSRTPAVLWRNSDPLDRLRKLHRAENEARHFLNSLRGRVDRVRVKTKSTAEGRPLWT